ncbi:sigma 54-interacting transcriptional regulator [Paratissierella segnis]|uniref:Sigma 54-interacting transcriptional regulator n=1 Tax=Paratissierella segnis TaxID=2763679 RepID=A0A926EZ00_9FIRM|nr:sigma-54-dependent transcriptional regulator [Paratissierella segnis]MBC8589087.1 sigma 54-interacting transcriptional regulator [Paratissierella segnis]
MKRTEKVYLKLKEMCINQYEEDGEIRGFSTTEIANAINVQRTNASSDLNSLYKADRVIKLEGKPVLYKIKGDARNMVCTGNAERDEFDDIIGSDKSLKNSIQQARAAVIYPPNGLHTLLLGETGTGKTMFAKVMYEYAKEIGKINSNAPFVEFNCADYANNPQLLMSQLFGVKKGVYTGADRDRTGFVEKANNGILFLDEIHRLPPEGQEMLFYLIDKGLYRCLGETEVLHKVNILIVCATTENVESTLLKTFIRRIPMIIHIPPLRDRALEERFQLIKYFFSDEAATINNDISITSNVLKALLLYDCPNNIGELKSDIKLCSAKAYLDVIMKKDTMVVVHTEDLPAYVRRGLIKYKENRDKIDKFINGDIIKFSKDDNSKQIYIDKNELNLYEVLEDKRNKLVGKGLDESDIKLIMNLDIETYIKRYMNDMSKKNLEELYKVVDKKIVDIVDNFLQLSGKELKRQFSERTLFGLSMHLASSIERILNGKKIENYQLTDIKNIYPEEYKVATGLRPIIREKFDLNIPDEEIGFITMFLCLDLDETSENEKVGVIVAMHGDTAATSISDVANRLLGEDFVIGYNMPLDQKFEVALNNLTAIIKKANKTKGILLLVDMGSLVIFGDMIHERTGIPIKTIEMVSTPIVLEAGRKALLNSSLDEVYDASINLSPYIGRIYKDNFEMQNGFKEDVIITACITGEGTALKLKSILENKLRHIGNEVDIIPLNIENKKEFKRKLQNIKREKNILAVVSAFNPDDDSLNYISTTDLFDNQKIDNLKTQISYKGTIKTIDNMKDIIIENLDLDAEKYIDSFKEFYLNIIKNGVDLDGDKLIGLILHIACAIERVLQGGELIQIENCKAIIAGNITKYEIIKTSLSPVNKAFNVFLSDDEYTVIMRMIYSV